MTQQRRAASIALFRDHEVLLIRRAFVPYQGMWTLPGGRLEPGETLADCVRREVAEELRLTIGAVTPMLEQALGDFRLTVFVGVFPDGATPAPNAEIVDWCWLGPRASLPEPHTKGLATVLARARATLHPDA